MNNSPSLYFEQFFPTMRFVSDELCIRVLSRDLTTQNGDSASSFLTHIISKLFDAVDSCGIVRNTLVSCERIDIRPAGALDLVALDDLKIKDGDILQVVLECLAARNSETIEAGLVTFQFWMSCWKNTKFVFMGRLVFRIACREKTPTI